MPGIRALKARREIAGFPFARIAEPHGHNGNPIGIVEGRVVHIHAFAQALATGIIPKNAGFMNTCSGCLADDENSSFATNPEHGSWAQRQIRRADVAFADLGR